MLNIDVNMILMNGPIPTKSCSAIIHETVIIKMTIIYHKLFAVSGVIFVMAIDMESVRKRFSLRICLDFIRKYSFASYFITNFTFNMVKYFFSSLGKTDWRI